MCYFGLGIIIEKFYNFAEQKFWSSFERVRFKNREDFIFVSYLRDNFTSIINTIHLLLVIPNVVNLAIILESPIITSEIKARLPTGQIPNEPLWLIFAIFPFFMRMQVFTELSYSIGLQIKL